MNSNDSEQPKSDLPLSDTTFTLASDPTFSFDLPEPVTPPPSSEETEQFIRAGRAYSLYMPQVYRFDRSKTGGHPGQWLNNQLSFPATPQFRLFANPLPGGRSANPARYTARTAEASLDQQPHCPSCGLLFPDYYVAVDPSEVRRQARNEYFAQKLAVLKSFNLSLGPVLGGGGRAVPAGYSPKRESRQAASKTFTFSKPRNLTTVAHISGLLLLSWLQAGPLPIKRTVRIKNIPIPFL